MKKQKIILMLILILTGLPSFAQYSNDDILEISMFLALDFEKKNLLNQSLYFYGVLYNLTHDEEVLTKINDLKHRL